MASLWTNQKDVRLGSRLGGGSKVHSLSYNLVFQPRLLLLQESGPDSILTTVFTPFGGNQGDCPLSNVPPSVGPASPSVQSPNHFRLTAGAAGCAMCQAWAPGRGGGIKTSYFGPGARPPGGQPGLFLPTPPGRCSPGRPLYSAHPRLSQSHRIRSGLPGGWAEMVVGSVMCPPDSLARLPHSQPRILLLTPPCTSSLELPARRGWSKGTKNSAEGFSGPGSKTPRCTPYSGKAPPPQP